eukprot:6174457-Pleurochrysis_carterae.AAC.2
MLPFRAKTRYSSASIRQLRLPTLDYCSPTAQVPLATRAEKKGTVGGGPVVGAGVFNVEGRKRKGARGERGGGSAAKGKRADRAAVLSAQARLAVAVVVASGPTKAPCQRRACAGVLAA